MPKKKTTEEFKEQLSIEHPELELLSEYKGNKEYVTVRCIKHDYIFNSKPNWLHKGCGCQKCYDERRGKTLLKSTESFIKEAKKIHGDKYNYSKVEYKGSKDKVCIICPEHGEFWQTPNKHLSGQGCPKCADIKNGYNKRLSKKEFIKKSKELHGNKYDYSKVEYIDYCTPVKIICPEHGEFLQKPSIHLFGCGCPICNSSHLENEIRNWLKENTKLFIEQKKFEWMGRQSLDFYIPSYYIGIECQGSQHFKSVEHFGGINEFEKRIKLDITKNQLCQEHGIKILYVVKEEDLAKCFKKKFLGLYNDDNVIEEDKLDKIQKIQEILGK